ncbi:MAG: LysM peptidoglycan-binding domain-containing protein [Sedimentisphaerales bacterium]|nr:LysM peptidoglycan-binding domain-containing protein [Sedimentisphaerales bacterium]
MTSDAKIGLLLGLIFIFVIAFIINGLPSLRPQTTKGEVTTNMMPTQDENLVLAERERKAQETISWSELLDQQTGEPDAAAATKSVEPTTPTPEQPVAADNAGEGVRSILPMPSADGLEKLTNGLADIVKTLAEASGPSTGQQRVTEPAPSVHVAQPQQSTADVRSTQAPVTDTAGPAASASTGAVRTYVVVDGDNLATIAKKMYGAEEGNRIINNQRIFEANRNVLKSPDDVAIGQELVIPPPARPKPVEKRPDTVLPRTLFEKVEAIGKRPVPAPDKTSPGKPDTAKNEPAKPATAERWYVVQEGDNLWKIASTQLGSGPRYEEIAKLNADALKGDVKINVGMRLRLPAR